jgi:rhamnopyranosyl-N-acetylglucosaminyl-diphospho-decaprenol beta-1,3/1,4-galactofuranosyltransferase
MENSEYQQLKVAAIIVSHNRRELLQRCINKLQIQTYPLEKILIVDNGSENDVIVYLESVKSVDRRIELLLQENLGGAGGFANGMKYALSEFIDLDYLWLMDDDGYPTVTALEELVKASKLFDATIFNSFVVQCENNLIPSWPFHKNMNKALSNPKLEYFVGYANFFNGTFIHKNILERLGYPIKKLFVKGDELEYFERAKLKLKLPIVTVRSSIFIHPSNEFSLHEDLPLDRIWHVYFNLRNYFFSHQLKINNLFLTNKLTIKIIQLYSYFHYWRKYKNDFLNYQNNNIKIKRKIINLALWHNIISFYEWKPDDVKKIIKLKTK